MINIRGQHFEIVDEFDNDTTLEIKKMLSLQITDHQDEDCYLTNME